MRTRINELYKHIAYRSHKDIDAICQPLRQYLKIDHFAYQRDVVDHERRLQLSLAPLCNNTKFMEFAVSYKRNTNPAIYNVTAKSQFYLLASFSPEYATDISKHVSIHNVFCRQITVNDNQREIFAFGSSENDPCLLNYYFNNIDLIDNFILYFREKAAKLLQQTWENKIPSSHPAIYLSENNVINEPNTRQAFLKAVTPKRYFIRDAFGNTVTIPAGEVNCLRLLIRGRSGKEIAAAMNISPRTVETYMERVKNRLSCYTRKQLLDLLDDNNCRGQILKDPQKF